MLYKSIHPKDLERYDNKSVAKRYSVSERTVVRAREYHNVPYTGKQVEFTEAEYRIYTRKRLAEKLGVTEHYIRKYAASQGWRKK